MRTLIEPIATCEAEAMRNHANIVFRDGQEQRLADQGRGASTISAAACTPGLYVAHIERLAIRRDTEAALITKLEDAQADAQWLEDCSPCQAAYCTCRGSAPISSVARDQRRPAGVTPERKRRDSRKDGT